MNRSQAEDTNHKCIDIISHYVIYHIYYYHFLWLKSTGACLLNGLYLHVFGWIQATFLGRNDVTLTAGGLKYSRRELMEEEGR